MHYIFPRFLCVKRRKMVDQRVFTLSQVAQHKSIKDCWFVVNGRVLDVTKFMEEHPGGGEVLVQSAGKDATKDFEAIGHSKAAQSLLLKYQLGLLEGAKLQEGDAQEFTAYEETQVKEMTAFVIKDDRVQKYVKFVEIFVPLLVAGFFFVYRYLTKVAQASY